VPAFLFVIDAGAAPAAAALGALARGEIRLSTRLRHPPREIRSQKAVTRQHLQLHRHATPGRTSSLCAICHRFSEMATAPPIREKPQDRCQQKRTGQDVQHGHQGANEAPEYKKADEIPKACAEAAARAFVAMTARNCRL
jgi:hypothetical protein